MIALILLLACGGAPAPEGTRDAGASPAATRADEPTLEDPCGAAWSELELLAEGLRERYGEQVRAPAEREFRAACERLPPAVRPCLSPRWANANTERCARAVQALERDERERFERALSPGTP